jgi:hypothetical protein
MPLLDVCGSLTIICMSCHQEVTIENPSFKIVDVAACSYRCGNVWQKDLEQACPKCGGKAYSSLQTR